jgi:chromosome segregation ATPase
MSIELLTQQELLARQEVEAKTDELKDLHATCDNYRNKQVKLEAEIKKANATVLEIRSEINHFADKINSLAIPRH